MDVLSEIIECSVCMERMDTKSKVLPCQHTFCSDCLLRISAQNKVSKCGLLYGLFMAAYEHPDAKKRDQILTKRHTAYISLWLAIV